MEFDGWMKRDDKIEGERSIAALDVNMSCGGISYSSPADGDGIFSVSI